MKALLLVLALTLPAAAFATIPMETAGTQKTSPGKNPPGKKKPAPHHQLITVKFVLQGKPSPLPHVVIDDSAKLLPPSPGNLRASPLGGGYGNPNTVVCYGRGCAAIGQ